MAIDRVPYSISLHWRYLRQDRRLTSTEISRIYRGRFSKATICRHMKQPIERQPKDNRKKNTGRPRLFDERDERRILRVAEQLRRLEGHFTIKRVKLAAGIQNVSDETVRRVFRKAGLRYCHSRKKGILKRADLKARLNFALRIKRNGNQHNLWQDEIAFYLDGVGFTHKYNPFDQAQAPRTMAWRRPHDGLDFERTTKGSHEGVGGRVAHFICAIAHDKGMVLTEQYHDRLNGENFAAFVRRVFPRLFETSANPEGKLFLQDGDPSQNSKKARDAFEEVGAVVFKIPARSPDLNPIENIFNGVKQKLREDALAKGIRKETFEEFSERCRKTLMNHPVQIINRTIESLPKRIDRIIKRRGQRTKY